ncbi:MAG: hypothetical protein JWP29_1916 [Rhodoferax sp.]|nr:hypothetical protein [Rhodoferax sp.]
MKEIRLCWATTITVVAGSAPVQYTDWEIATPDARERLEAESQSANASDGPDTYWVEERDTPR